MPHSIDAPVLARELAASSSLWFWLDGDAAPAGESRTSYLGAATELLVAEAGEERAFLDELRARQTESSRKAENRGKTGEGQRFSSGWVVAFGYEFGVGLHDAGMVHPTDIPPAFALRIDEVTAATHHTATEHTDMLESVFTPTPITAPASTWRTTPARYEEQVEACKAAIHRGDAYVLCLTDTAETVTRGPVNPLELFERLRAGGAASRGGVIVAGDRALVSASPERFLSVHGRTVATHPIKGTRRRGATPEEDAALAAALAGNLKEQAENLMIVDLMRNDLSRVCAQGTVRVERFLDVETHPSVHQLVSTVAGELSEGLDVFDALAACFPGGSMTGAPKRSAISILGDLERAPRGLYSGCFGWIDDAGDAELAMTIRGIELRGNRETGLSENVRVLVGAGGGITADSVPADERAERDLKAAAVLAAIEPQAR
ncbi:MAG: anthranilate synthase component I family protein [Leucobacter sp.]